jgi:hypothetical protein
MRLRASLVLILLAGGAPFAVGAAARGGDQASPSPGHTDLDTLMARALDRREVNRRTLTDYVLNEVETFELVGPGRVPLYRFRREYTWYVRDGLHVRSPVRVDGVAIDEADRRRYEDEWFRREQARRTRVAGRRADSGPPVPQAGRPAGSAGAAPVIEPRFVSEAYFLDFTFEPGRYYLVGHETLDGRDVLRVEYYPTRMFADEERERPEGASGRRNEAARPERTPRGRKTTGEGSLEAELERKMNKTSLVTLWVDPVEHQIVRYTFENVWLDFLPGRWIVRVDGIEASMTMGQPFEGVWLPRAIAVRAGITLATGSYTATYTRTFSDYRQAEVTSKIRVIKEPESR